MNDSASRSVRVRVVETDAEMAAQSTPWEALQTGAAVTSVFETFDWQYLWWRSYGRGQPLRLLLATADGELVGILPLYIEAVSIVSTVRLLRFVGTGGDTSPDDLGPILAKGWEAEAARALADAVLQMSGWDVLQLADMQPDNAFVAEMRSRAAGARLSLRAGRSERITYLDLPKSFDGWLQSLNGDRRYRVRTIRKKANAAHQVRFFVWDDPRTLDQGIETLVRLHKKRWAETGESRSFGSSAYIDFHTAVIKACFAHDRLRLYCLEFSGSIVAVFYFYRFRGRVYLMQSGFDPEYSRLKPGQVLLGYIVEHAIGEGHEQLDFLRGDHRYKDELATGERETVYLEVFRPTLGAYLYRTRRIYLPAARAWMRRSVRQLRGAAKGEGTVTATGEAPPEAAPPAPR